MQIIILGMHRSGTSAVTRLVNMMGAYFGEEGDSIGAADENPKGFWERKDIIDCNDRILKFRQATWDNMAQLIESKEVPEEILVHMRAILHRLSAYDNWVIKDPRFCLTLSQWKPYLEKPVVVVVYRDPIEVAESLHTRNRIPLKIGLAMWEQNMASALTAAMDMPKIFVRHADVIRDPVKATKRMYDDLIKLGATRLTLPGNEEILNFIDPALYRSKPGSGAVRLSDYQQELAAYASGSASLTKPLMLSAPAKEYLEFYAYMHEDHKKINTLKGELTAAELKIAASEQHILQLKGEVERLASAHAPLQQENAELHAQLAESGKAVAALNARLDYIYSTLWWKLGRNFAAILRSIGLRK